MGRIAIQVSSRMTMSEKPIWDIQVMPDRIKYQLKAGGPSDLLNTMVTGEAGYNTKIQEALEILAKAKWLTIDGDLFRAWLKYNGASNDSKDLRTDTPMFDALDDFQRRACAGPSYLKLLTRAQKVAFWERAAEVPLPRITELEHRQMG